MTGRTDWYSSPDWNRDVEKVFEAKLRRARNKGEYLRVKGVTLIQQRDRQRRDVGRRLLGRLADEYPDTPTISWAYEALGDADTREGRYTEAESQYTNAIAAYERIPGVQGNAQVKLANLIATTKQRSRYPEAETLLDQYRPFWKIEHFWVHLARARMAADRGDAATAGAEARLALTAEADPNPQAPRHPTMGHVQTDEHTLAELRRLAHTT
jgi:hypothetical protein